MAFECLHAWPRLAWLAVGTARKVMPTAMLATEFTTKKYTK